MRTELKRADLHTPLFLGGTNLGVRLDPSKRTGLKLAFDEEERQLMVEWNSELGRIPEANVAVMVEGKAAVVKINTPAQREPINAQVSTPQSHVHAGPGHGKSK